MLFLFLSLSKLYAQDQKGLNFSDTIQGVFIPPGDLFAFKDTVIQGGETIIIRKEVWIRTRDSLFLIIDTIDVLEDELIFMRDSVITIKDTVVIIQDTILTRNERVLKEIKEFTRRNTLFSRLLRNIFIFEEARPVVQEPVEQSDKFFEPYEGKIIRSVNIKVIDVFGSRLSNPDRKPKNILEKSGNFLHVKTQRWIVRNQLLFEKGDTINSLKVSESERLLRQNNFIYDARVIVKDYPDSDSVDVLVMVQDVWNINVSGDADPSASNYGATYRDVNFFGLGHQLDGRVRLAPFLTKGYNLAGSYYINNIYRTLLSAQIFYRYEYGQTVYGLGVNRDFISPAIKWAGGSNINWYSLTHTFVDANDSVSVQPMRFIQGDSWIGYGLNISNERSKYKGTRIILAGRIIKSHYYEAPVLPDTIRSPYYTNDLYLSSIGIISRRFYKDYYIFRLGRTEDIPEGQFISFVWGAENSFKGIRPYTGLIAAWGRYSQKFGFFYWRAGLGGFREAIGWTQGVVGAQSLYFTPLINFGSWKCRQFIGGRFTRGLNTLYGSYVSVSHDQGLRGFSSGRLRGTSRLVLNYEVNFYPPLNLLGFRFAFVLFTDLAWVSVSSKLIDKENFYPAFGAGLRFRNDHLIFSMVQLMLGYYPYGPALGEQELRVFETKKFFYNYYNFNYSRPSTLPLD
jgi:hypothetical protein